MKKKHKTHYCPITTMQTPCGRHWIDVRTTPLTDLRFITCKSCRKHIEKSREKAWRKFIERRRHVYVS